MKRILSITLLLSILSYSLTAQNSPKSAIPTEKEIETEIYTHKDMAQLFVDMPDSVVPYLSRNMREDMVDYFVAGIDKKISNLLKEESYISSIDTSKIEVTLSKDKSFLEIKRLFTAKGDTLYALIETVSLPARDSRVYFFNTSWQPENSKKFFVMPKAEDFFVAVSSAEAKELSKALNISFISLTFSNNLEIEAFLGRDLAKYLPEETSKTVVKYLIEEPLQYIWNGKKFIKQPK